MTDERIDRLEIRLSEQERVIEDLNATITAQWRAIDKLTGLVGKLSAQVEDAAHRDAAGAPEPPPPHY